MPMTTTSAASKVTKRVVKGGDDTQRGEPFTASQYSRQMSQRSLHSGDENANSHLLNNTRHVR